MSQSKLKVYTEEANPILESYFHTLLGQENTFTFGQASQAQIEELTSEASTSFLIVGNPENAEPFIVQLEPDWIPVISNAMVGREMTPFDEGVFDLTGQIISKSYDSLRESHTHCAALPALLVTPSAPGTWTPGADLPTAFWRLPFEMEVGAKALKGHLFVASALVDNLKGKTPAAPAAKPASTVLDEVIDVSTPKFPDFGKESLQHEGPGNFDLLAEVELNVTVELGRRKIPLSEVLRLTTGSVIELEKLVGEPLDIFANGRLIAEGEAVVIEEQFGIRITNLASNRLKTKAFA